MHFVRCSFRQEMFLEGLLPATCCARVQGVAIPQKPDMQSPSGGLRCPLVLVPHLTSEDMVAQRGQGVSGRWYLWTYCLFLGSMGQHPILLVETGLFQCPCRYGRQHSLVGRAWLWS